MWWSEDAVPRWIERSLLAAFLTPIGFVCALLASGPVAVLIAPLIPDAIGAWLLWRYEIVYLIALACGLALALLADLRASRSRRAAPGR